MTVLDTRKNSASYRAGRIFLFMFNNETWIGHEILMTPKQDMLLKPVRHSMATFCIAIRRATLDASPIRQRQRSLLEHARQW